MVTLDIEIRNEYGLHARPSALFVKLASKFKSEIKVISEGEEVNGKSILGLMLLAAEKGRILKIIIEGEDEEEASKALKNLVEFEKFGEA